MSLLYGRMALARVGTGGHAVSETISITPTDSHLHSLHTVSCSCGWMVPGLSATRAVLARDKHRAWHANDGKHVQPLWDD